MACLLSPSSLQVTAFLFTAAGAALNSSQWAALAVAKPVDLITARVMEKCRVGEFMCCASERQLYRSRKTHPRLRVRCKTHKNGRPRDIETALARSLIE